jgi:hypothetical protein
MIEDKGENVGETEKLIGSIEVSKSNDKTLSERITSILLMEEFIFTWKGLGRNFNGFIQSKINGEDLFDPRDAIKII